MSNDIHQILEKLAAIEGKLVFATPASKGLDSQQKDAKQLPALFKPKTVKVLGAKTDPKNPMAGYMVGANESEEPTTSSLEEAMQEVEEDMLSKVKKDLTTYLDKLEQKVRVDRDLKDKAKDEIKDENPAKPGRQDHHEEEEIEEDPTTTEVGDVPEQMPAAEVDPTLPEGACVKSYTMEDGSSMECWGNERDGFELRRGDRKLPTRFKDLDQADTAVKLYQARRQKNNIAQDYIEEK
jgi:hypothetical protein